MNERVVSCIGYFCMGFAMGYAVMSLILHLIG